MTMMDLIHTDYLPTGPTTWLLAIALVLLVVLYRIFFWRRKRKLRHDFNMNVAARLFNDEPEADLENARGMDLTEDGMRLLWSKSAPEPMSRVTIFLQEIERSASVVWSNGKSTGVRFDKPLSAAQVKELTMAAMQSRLANG